MFTKLFKKSHDPYELGGRWYKFETDNANASSPVYKCDNIFDPNGFTVSGSNFFFTINKPNLTPVAAFIIRDFSGGVTPTSGLTQGYSSTFKYIDGRTAFQASLLSSTGKLVAYIYCI